MTVQGETLRSVPYSIRPVSEHRHHVDIEYWKRIHADYWQVPLIVTALYLVGIFQLQKYLSARKPYDLKRPLFIWNSMLAIFSLFACYRTLPEALTYLLRSGLAQSICDNSYQSDEHILFWHLMFSWSKFLELGDTLFIVLRKRPLSFIHWYHHSLTLISCYLYFPLMAGITRWSVAINYLVHSIMYSYFALKALGVHFHKLVPMSITALQVAQMFVGFYLAMAVFQTNLAGNACLVGPGYSLMAFVGYFTYVFLFVKFFFDSYFGRVSKKFLVKVE